MTADTSKKPLSKQELETLKELTQKVLNGDATPEDFQLMTELGTRKAEESKERKGEIANASSIIKVWAITFAELQKELGTSAFHTDAVLSTLGKDAVIAYCDEQGWISSGAPAASSKKGGDGEPKEKLVIGTFKLADYGFEMPKKVNGEPASNATEFEWDWNKRYGGRSWETPFINAIVAEGIEKAKQHFTPQFQAWLDETDKAPKGRYAGKPVYNNRAEFYDKFGITINKLTGEVEGATPSTSTPMTPEAPAAAPKGEAPKAQAEEPKAQPEEAKAQADEGKKPAAKSSKKAEDKKGDDKKDEKATA